MITIRGLLFIIFLTSSGGCAKCPLPSYPTGNTDNCWYYMKVTKIDEATGFVEAKYPDSLVSKYEAKPDAKFRFRVRDLEWLVKKNQLREGGEYYFNNGHGSSFLEAFPEGYGPEDYGIDKKW